MTTALRILLRASVPPSSADGLTMPRKRLPFHAAFSSRWPARTTAKRLRLFAPQRGWSEGSDCEAIRDFPLLCYTSLMEDKQVNVRRIIRALKAQLMNLVPEEGKISTAIEGVFLYRKNDNDRVAGLMNPVLG